VSGLVKSSVSPARLAAFEILLRVEDGAYSSILLAAKEEKLNPPDRALCHELVMGVLRRQSWLDRLIEHYSNRSADKLDLAVRLILRLGLYQLRFLSRVPPSAAVNEAVNLVNVARKRSAGGLVNAVMRRATREPNVDPARMIQDPIERLAVSTSHPNWLIKRWIDQFGSDNAEALAHANNEPAPVSFRIVNNRASEAEVIEELTNAGAELLPSAIARRAWRVSGAGNLLSELVARGQIYFQDEASQLVSEVLNAGPGQRVLDLCAAPGSKATQIADMAHDSSVVVAADLHKHRLKMIAASAKLHGLKSIHCLALDGLHSLPFIKDSFDRVLVDAPCSGTGTLRRNPEIRWRISPDDIHDLSERQTQLLLNAAQAVKPGGWLVYSTCSVETDENEHVRQTFLENNSSFKPIELTLDASHLISGAARTWPHRDGTDGFFICAFERETQ
jgi:16S rRNA (cytosine967-C5)-methyltransferase